VAEHVSDSFDTRVFKELAEIVLPMTHRGALFSIATPEKIEWIVIDHRKQFLSDVGRDRDGNVRPSLLPSCDPAVHFLSSVAYQLVTAQGHGVTDAQPGPSHKLNERPEAAGLSAVWKLPGMVFNSFVYSFCVRGNVGASSALIGDRRGRVQRKCLRQRQRFSKLVPRIFAVLRVPHEDCNDSWGAHGDLSLTMHPHFLGTVAQN
jgi:hypothetical protein